MKPKTEQIKLSDIIADDRCQLRASIDQPTVDEYAEAMLAGEQFPPLIIFSNVNEFFLADGFHRHRAAKQAGFETFACAVHIGGIAEARRHAITANRQHGLRLSSADKRRVVSVALEEWPSLSDREIARQCGVSPSTVASIRQVSNLDTSTRTGRDGKKYKLPPPPIKATPAEKKTIPPPIVRPTPPPPSEVLDGTGLPISQYLLPIWERRHEAQEMMSTVSRLKGAIRKAQDEKDVLFARVNFSALLAHLDNSYQEIKCAKPYAVCLCQGKNSDACRLCRGLGFISEFLWNSGAITEEQRGFRKKQVAQMNRKAE